MPMTVIRLLAHATVAGLESSIKVDFRIDKKWIFDTWMLNAYRDIQNVTDRVNPESIAYDFDYSEATTSGS